MHLLRLLADGRFHSGDELGATLGISRSAVWKQLQHLQSQYGLMLYKVRGKGYRLEQGLSLLSVDMLKERLPQKHFLVEELVDSTNNVATRNLAQYEPPYIVLAEMQTAGRGRRGRLWVSPYGKNLYFSQLVRIERSATQLQALSLVVGLAVLRTLQSFGVMDVGVKWPNDLLVNGRKIAGILLELNGDPADVCHVVIGVGINANMLANDGIDQAWTSMQLELGRLVNRNELVVTLAEELDKALTTHKEQGFSAFREEWARHHLWLGREVQLDTGRDHVVGVLLGVTTDGALRLSVAGMEQVYSGGELSLRLRHDS